MDLSRRRLLSIGSAGLALPAIRPGGILGIELFGRSNGLSANFKVLEVFLEGGLSHREALWLAGGSYASWSDEPIWSDIDGFDTAASDWSHDGITLSKATSPLQDYSDRLRVVAMGHDLEPHTAAVALAATGKTIGRPRQAGSGAAIQRLAGGSTPVSWVLRGWRGARAARAASTTGLHGAEHRPISLSVSSASGADDIIDEFLVARNTSRDALRDVYRNRYEDRLRFSGSSVRSAGHEAFVAASNAAHDAEAIGAQLDGGTLQLTGDTTYQNNHTRTALQMAAHLLSNDARYVCVIDSGVHSTYDTHDGTEDEDSYYATLQAGNLWSTLDEVAALIDSGALDLDDTLVVFNTEFGRKDQTTGSNHHPDGYGVMCLGGPVGLDGSSGVSGAFDEDDVVATHTHANPTALRVAVLAAAGIDPFHSDNFDPDELDAALGETALIQDAIAYFFGVGV